MELSSIDFVNLMFFFKVNRLEMIHRTLLLMPIIPSMPERP